MSTEAAFGTTRKTRKETLARIDAKVREALTAKGAEDDLIGVIFLAVNKRTGVVTNAGVLYGGRPMAATFATQVDDAVAQMIGAVMGAEDAKREQAVRGKRRLDG